MAGSEKQNNGVAFGSLLPLNSRRRLAASMAYNAITSPRSFAKNLTLANLKRFLSYIRSEDPRSIEGRIRDALLAASGSSVDYSDKVASELKVYKDNVNIHDLPPIYSYWSKNYLRPKFETLGLTDMVSIFAPPVIKVFEKKRGTVKVASLGAGNCDFEIEIAKRVLAAGDIQFEMHCYELNPEMIERGKAHAEKEGILKYFRFVECDINKITLAQDYDIFMANQSLHHFEGLEHIFSTVRKHMSPDGYFVVSDMIGRNGHMLWPEAYEIVAKIWPLLDKEKTWQHQLRRYEKMYENWDCSKDGFEGIRAQDIMPLLVKDFRFELFYAFANIIDVFIGRGFGHNFDENDKYDRAFIDYVSLLDEKYLKEGRIKPTHLIARMTLGEPAQVQTVDGFTPEKCVRDPKAK